MILTDDCAKAPVARREMRVIDFIVKKDKGVLNERLGYVRRRGRGRGACLKRCKGVQKVCSQEALGDVT